MKTMILLGLVALLGGRLFSNPALARDPQGAGEQVVTATATARVSLAARRPNVVIILSDDAGYADFSMQGSTSVPTPRIDSIAANGVRFTNGYVSASVCSPSRAGLLTGRYQQRFGHELNIPPRQSDVNGLPLTEETFADVMKAGGYRTIGLGKWHLGYAEHFHPMSRGFSDWYGFLQGSRSYWPMEGTKLNRLQRDRAPIPETFDYMTDELGRQAASYIATHAKAPFFLYLAFNAVHGPMHATEQDLATVSGPMRPVRKKLIAMTKALDRSVGYVLDELEKQKLTDQTLLVFINDNGGATNNGSQNTPLRGKKGSAWEGGHRIPFAIQWPGKIPARTTYDAPVITLDLLPTARAAAGITTSPKNPLDGVNLLPYLTGGAEGRPHPTLFWRMRNNWAIRHHDLKLVHQTTKGEASEPTTPQLFDLSVDPSETRDLAAQQPEKAKELQALYDAWSATLATPRW